jgi:hypothetical protein
LARIDDYKQAFDLAAEKLKASNVHRLSRLAGGDFELPEEGFAVVRFLYMGEPYRVAVGRTVEIVQENRPDEEIPLPVQVLIAHYLLGASNEPPSGQSITYREVPDGRFYMDAFQRRAREPLLATFGRDPDLFLECAERLGGRPVELGDAAVEFRVFPRIPVRLVLWEGDEEFEPEANILFDSNISAMLSAEDIALMASFVVYRLMGVSRLVKSENRA